MSHFTQGGLMTLPQELCCLVKINSDVWHRRWIVLGPEAITIRKLESRCQVVKVEEDDMMGLKREGEERLLVWACVREGSRRHIKCLEVEGEGVGALAEYLEKDNFKVKKRKKLLVLVNPVGGRGRAVQIWKQVESAVGAAGLDTEVVLTQYSGHARDLVSELEVGNYGGVVTVSGDGGLHDVLNGLWSRRDWTEIKEDFHIGMVPGGSGHAVHCSLLHHQGEDFSQEIEVATLNISRGRSRASDVIECSSGGREFVSIFGVSWGVIPECDLGSEFLRWLGPNRGYILAAWRILVPRLHHGTVYYLADQDDAHDAEIELPDLDSPVPSSWKTLEGPFFNVYVLKQPWLDYASLFCPEAQLSDGKMWLVVIMASMTRAGLLRWALNTEGAGHLQEGHSLCVPIKAFRFAPCQPGPDCPMTVDAERLEGDIVQGKVKINGCRIMAK